MSFHSPVGIVDHLTILRPGHSIDTLRIINAIEQIQQQLLAVAPADKVHFRTLQLDEPSVEAGEASAKGQFHMIIRRAYLSCENLRVGVASGTEKAQSNQRRFPFFDLLNNIIV